MKLKSIILTSALMIAVSMQAMEHEEGTALPIPQQIPNELKIEDGLLGDRVDKDSLNAASSNFKTELTKMKKANMKHNAKVCLLKLCCCPCYACCCIWEQITG